jgi:hypothetical protein
MSKNTSEQIKSIKFGFNNQISDVESKLFNTQRRIQDSLIEFSNNTNEKIDKLNKQTMKMKTDFREANTKIEESLVEWKKFTIENFSSTNMNFESKLLNLETKLDSESQRVQQLFLQMTKKSNFQFEAVKEDAVLQTKTLKTILMNSLNQFDESFKKFEHIEQENFDTIRLKLECFLQTFENKMTSTTSSTNSLLNEKSTYNSDELIKKICELEFKKFEIKFNKLDVKLDETIKAINNLLVKNNSK